MAAVNDPVEECYICDSSYVTRHQWVEYIRAALHHNWLYRTPSKLCEDCWAFYAAELVKDDTEEKEQP